MSGKPTIHVIGTGGTISGAGSSATATAYESGQVEASESVSYTHLTLPTILLV